MTSNISNTSRIGFIGLGALGQGLCTSLVRGGFTVTVTDLNRDLGTALVAQGALWADDVAALCKASDIVITALPSPAISRQVVEGAGGVFESLRSGGIWIEMSTTDFEDLQRLQAAAQARGISGSTRW